MMMIMSVPSPAKNSEAAEPARGGGCVPRSAPKCHGICSKVVSEIVIEAVDAVNGTG